MKMFWTLVSIDALIFAIPLWFFLLGLGDGTVSSFNIAIWLPMVGVPAAVLSGGLLLWSRGKMRVAKLLLAALAMPGLAVGLFGLFVVVMFATHPGSHH